MTINEERRELLVKEALKWIGTKETGGENRGKEVEMFQRAVDGKAQGEPWCLAFVQFCVKAAGKEYERRHGGVNKPDVFYQTEHCMTLWSKTDPRARLNDPIPGCLVIWQYWKDGRPTPQGHVGIVVSVFDQNIETVEGNTSGATSIEREGDVVARKFRRRFPSGSMRVKGYLVPWID